MELLEDRIGLLYRKYLIAALGSGVIESAYTLADAMVVGHYYGANGEAALSVFMPIWNLLFGSGLMFGIGGSALYSMQLGAGHKEKAKEIYTASVALFAGFMAVLWIVFLVWDDELFYLFGGNAELVALLKAYSFPIKFVMPCYGIVQLLGAYLRNDFDAKRAAAAAVTGGVFNIIADVVFVFVFDMGMFGAGLATAMGSLITTVIMLSHYRKPDNALKFVKIPSFKTDAVMICENGLSSFILDLAMGIIAIFFNRQIMVLYDSEILGIYGAICQASCMIQSMAYAIGEAAQPIISANFGAGNHDRVKKTLGYAVKTAFGFGIFWMVTVVLFPKAYLYLFMDPSAKVLKAGPTFLRIYGLSFLLLSFNVFSTFYYQSVDRPRFAFMLTIGRALVLSGILVYLLPAVWGGIAVWAVMPVTEAVIALAGGWNLNHSVKLKK